ncbi:diguanylate cyclase/phosphodiesterase with PAS/PAC sensor(s) [Arcobacter nitrofigilis DSM 7299]|uniref:Diguanylate cyclase/phosphodiesterase with PAS/PAC sensor(S) n=1 Tax=Arcobacter nitrofigilis (strain ATCC 33309 / DSM 7299 / CCUG 15893 / LMG 7604 / NCTC 12251 / CI) TaxID=572480 RepID=D5V2N3_ARCNC|nr:EAL domain-containing protein [Arcobacter nitrofigilis]ADG92465.1 diguanylate cyclase/phosphodiesterase with PAS/PAC sensor(s) [Arcobacter nitrofigilis DSM 7299]
MKLTLSKINFINIFSIIVVFSIILGFFIYEFNQELYEKKVVSLEKSYFKKNKAIIKNEIERAIKRIEVINNLIYEKNESILKEKVSFVKNLFDSNKEKNFNIVLSKYKKELNLFKWDNGTGYFYIFDKNGKILYHGGNKKYVNTNVFESSKTNKELYDFLKETLILDENYGSYKWYKPNESPKEIFTKYVYIKKDEKYDVYIAAGVYKKEIDKKVQKLIFEEFKKDKFGDNKYGYFWILGLDKVMKMHALSPELEGKINNHVLSIKGKVLNDIAIKKALDGGGYINYKWIRPDTKKEDEKFSYVKLIPKWNLLIGAGFYITELQDILKEEKKSLRELSNEYLSKVFVVLIILITISLFIARYLSVKIHNVENEREEHMNMLKQYKLLLDRSSVVSKTDKDGIITYVNDSFEKTSGYNKNELIGISHKIIAHPDTPRSQSKKLWDTILKGKIWKGILKNKRKDGVSYYNSITIIPIKDSQGNIKEFISAGTIVTELIENRSKLKNLFKTDALTGLGNRVSLIDHISKQQNGTLALINIDRFKEINDSHSHVIGDKVITSLSDRLFRYFNDKGYDLYRLQSDIFALFTVNKDRRIDDINEFMNTLGKEPYIIGKETFILTYTCGIASNSENLLTYADIALTEAKNKKVKIKEYNNSMKNIEEFKNNLLWVERLHLAIKENRIFPHYQPIYNYKTGKIDKYEALMRLYLDGKIIYPNEYLDIAKKTKLYPELTYKMVEEVISKFSTNNYEFSLNLCIEDLMNEELMIYVFDYAEQKGVFKRMVLEIVESEEIDDSDYINKLLRRFKEEGVKIAIDDFGSGYSNYDYLIKLQADYLKIDGSIIKLIENDIRTQNVVKSIFEFAQKSNIKVIAEFVSNENIDKILREIGIDYAQGFYYGKPEAKLIDEIN